MDKEQANKIIADYRTAENAKRQALSKLQKYDYIGRKISEAVLLGDEEELNALRTEYADVITEAKTLRTTVNQCDEQLKALWNDYKEARESNL